MRALRRGSMRLLLAGALVFSPALVAGCDSEPTTTVIIEPEPSVEETSSLSALERGRVRREVLDELEPAIAAWVAGDREAFGENFGELPQKPMFEVWDEAEDLGYTINRSHDRIVLDVTELNDSGTQALVSYDFMDHTIVTASDGTVVGPDRAEEVSFQLTVELTGDGEWTIVRMIGPVESIR